jgi:CDP-diacylglycerol--glycerol-3-phosphate 3-phosphatidyltransferase
MTGASRRYDGPMGKSDRAFVFGVLGAAVAVGWLSALWINIVLAIVCALLVFTLYNRVTRGLDETALPQE